MTHLPCGGFRSRVFLLTANNRVNPIIRLRDLEELVPAEVVDELGPAAVEGPRVHLAGDRVVGMHRTIELRELLGTETLLIVVRVPLGDNAL
ncbi:hypothetical protein D9M69_634270 [compost metagenome]